MRIRSIKPTFFKNEVLAELPAHARLLFVGLWTLADVAGRLVDKPKRIRAEVFPYEDLDVHGLLQQLADAGFILRYQVAGEHYLEVIGFRRHQRLTGKEAGTISEIPAPPSSVDAIATVNGGASADVSPLLPRGVTDAQEGKGREGKGVEEQRSPALPLDSPEIRLAAWITTRSKDPEREAENRATLRALVDTYGEAAVQRAAAAWAHREHAKAYPDQLLPALGQAAHEPPPPEDPAVATARVLIAEHGWQRVLTATGFIVTSNITDEEALLAALAGNLPVCRKLPQRLQASLAGRSPT